MGLEMVLSIKNELSVLRFLDAVEDAVSATPIAALAMQYHVCVSGATACKPWGQLDHN